MTPRIPTRFVLLCWSTLYPTAPVFSSVKSDRLRWAQVRLLRRGEAHFCQDHENILAMTPVRAWVSEVDDAVVAHLLAADADRKFLLRVLRQCPGTIQFKSQHCREPETHFLSLAREANPTFRLHEAAYRALLVRLHEHPNFVQHRSVYGNSLHIALSIMAVVPQFRKNVPLLLAVTLRLADNTDAHLGHGLSAAIHRLAF